MALSRGFRAVAMSRTMFSSERDRGSDRCTGRGLKRRGATSSTRPLRQRKSKKHRKAQRWRCSISADKSLRDISIRNSRTSRWVTFESRPEPQKTKNSLVTSLYVHIVPREYRWHTIQSINLDASWSLLRLAKARSARPRLGIGNREQISKGIRNNCNPRSKVDGG